MAMLFLLDTNTRQAGKARGDRGFVQRFAPQQNAAEMPLFAPRSVAAVWTEAPSTSTGPIPGERVVLLAWRERAAHLSK